MNFRSKISIFILAALLSVLSFGSSAFAAEDITSRLKVEPKSIKNSGSEWSIDISGQNVKEGDWATFRAENVSVIPAGKVDLKYKNEKIGEISVDKKYSDGHDLNYQSVVRNDDNAKPGAIVWQGKIVFNKNIEKYANFETSISNSNANYFSYVNRDVTIETKIIGSTTLKGEDVKLTKSPLLKLDKTSLGGSVAQFNSNNGESIFELTILQSMNKPVKAGTRVKITMDESSSVQFNDQKTYQVGRVFWLAKMRESISASTPVNKHGVYFAGGPGMEAKVLSLSKTEIVFEITKDVPATDGVYRSFMASIDVVDGSNIKDGKIGNIKHTVELIAPDGSVIDRRDENTTAAIFGSNVETYAKIRKPEAKPQKPAPAPTPAQPQPAVEVSKDEKPSEEKVQAPNTGFEKSQNFIILAFAILVVTTAVVFRKKLAKIKI
jgi:LPXTG-motif cell wall anchor domain protein